MTTIATAFAAIAWASTDEFCKVGEERGEEEQKGRNSRRRRSYDAASLSISGRFEREFRHSGTDCFVDAASDASGGSFSASVDLLLGVVSRRGADAAFRPASRAGKDAGFLFLLLIPLRRL